MNGSAQLSITEFFHELKSRPRKEGWVTVAFSEVSQRVNNLNEEFTWRWDEDSGILGLAGSYLLYVLGIINEFNDIDAFYHWRYVSIPGVDYIGLDQNPLRPDGFEEWPLQKRAASVVDAFDFDCCKMFYWHAEDRLYVKHECIDAVLSRVNPTYTYLSSYKDLRWPEDHERADIDHNGWARLILNRILRYEARGFQLKDCEIDPSIAELLRKHKEFRGGRVDYRFCHKEKVTGAHLLSLLEDELRIPLSTASVERAARVAEASYNAIESGTSAFEMDELLKELERVSNWPSQEDIIDELIQGIKNLNL